MLRQGYQTLRLEVEEKLAILTLHRPEHGNGYNEAMGLELLEALHELADPQVRAVVLTGAGEDFCIGLDPEFLRASAHAAPKAMRKSIGYLNQVVSELRRLPKPVIAAVHGRALGTGFAFALAADFIFAEQGAHFSASYISMGLSPDGGLSYFLTRLVGPQKCAELVMTGKPISARRALEMGILSGVVPQERLLEESKNLALYFSGGPTLALGKAKRLIDTALSHSLEEQLEEERQALILVAGSRDYQEGLQATGPEKKKPNFEGR